MVLLCLLVTFFVYANWEEPGAGERIYFESPTALAVFTVPAGMEVDDINDPRIIKARGVSSYTYSPAQNRIAITYAPRQTNENELLQTIRQSGIDVETPPMTSTKPQCPVDGYLYYFYRLKYALCLRK